MSTVVEMDVTDRQGSNSPSSNLSPETFTHASTYTDSALNVNHNVVVHQRRRVNPESLAQRLGPDLVRDLDALITPGNTEMPSFAVRKELQERYNIDRRHIYDYFHSRGLRVVKEDKHGNVVTPKEPVYTPLPSLRRIRQPNPKSFPSQPSHTLTSGSRWTAPKPRGITKAKPNRVKKNISSIPKPVHIVRETSETNVPDDVTEHTPSLPAATYVVVNPLSPLSSPKVVEEDEHLTFNSIENPLDESFSIARAIGDIAYSYRHTRVFQRMQELNEYPIKSIFADDSPVSRNETSLCSVSDEGLLLSHVKPLSPDERRSIYKTLSESLGPARGIQECQGTYRKYMESRTKLYFEGLLSVPCPHHQSSKASASVDRKPALATNEFRQWLPEIKFLERDSMHNAQRLRHNYRSANAARPYGIDISTEKSSAPKSVFHWIQTLDDLFPNPVQTSKSGLEITDSPVVRTREPSCPAPLFFSDSLGDESGERDQPLISSALSPTLPVHADAGQIRRAQFHELPDFPGHQQVTARAQSVDLAGPQTPQRSQSSHRLAAPQPSNPGIHIAQYSPQKETPPRTRVVHLNNSRIRFAPHSPYKPFTHDRDRIKTRSIRSRDARRRTPSAAGDI